MSTDSIVVMNTKKEREREKDQKYRQAFQERERKVHKHLEKMHKVEGTVQVLAHSSRASVLFPVGVHVQLLRSLNAAR